jgi:DNA repair exonuclease SbcCD ATPase subunit
MTETLLPRTARGEAGNKLRESQARTPWIGELAQLKEYGSRISLQDGHCPLCGLAIDEKEFASHLTKLQDEINRHNRELGELTANEADQTQEYQKRSNEFQILSLEYSSALSDVETLKAAQNQLQSEALALGTELEPQALERDVESSRRRAAELQSGLLQLEGSTAFDRIADLEKQRSLAQSTADEIAARIDSLSQITQNARIAVDTTKRVSWESVDDCLAALSPLLSELFVRLKPHVDYSEIRYHMRGDIRRFLSFEIGKGINPRFTFSSGQRRVLGIAFLLAVHLSRPWCKLQTLVLDDPVQHIDDYRALHLAEVLSSLRQMGHQIICTVEDPALADLLCRRLRSTAIGDGMRIEMEYEPNVGVKIKEKREVGPLPERLLKLA